MTDRHTKKRISCNKCEIHYCFGDYHFSLEKSRLSEVPEVENYVTSLQETPDNRGFKIFAIEEGRKWWSYQLEMQRNH